jgi:aminoglycoside phosphotransferase (APT) family kinase protein
MAGGSPIRNDDALMSSAWLDVLHDAMHDTLAPNDGKPAAHKSTAPAFAITGLRRLSGGASQETWRFDLVEGDRVTPLILRRAPGNAPSVVGSGGSAGLAAEAALFGLAATAGVPVPAVRAVLRPEHGLGEGFVMDRIDGETLGRKIVRETQFAAAREQLAYQCGQAMARIHRIPASSLPPLRVAPAAAELAHYRGVHRSHETSKPVFELAFQWLLANAPPVPAHPVLVHGDYRNGNLIVDTAGLRAVLDWELAHLGDGMEDLGWICVNSWRFGRTDLPVGGFGTREQLFAGYEAAGGVVDAARVHYWQVLGTLKWGIICEGMAHSYLSGAERNVEKAAIGRRASETEIDLLELLVPPPGTSLARKTGAA